MNKKAYISPQIQAFHVEARSPLLQMSMSIFDKEISGNYGLVKKDIINDWADIWNDSEEILE